MHAAPWTLEDHIARLGAVDLSATLNVRRPWAGLTELQYRNRPLGKLRILQVVAPFQPATDESRVEEYIRANDLVATYPQTDQRNVRAQLYWRHLSLPRQAPRAHGCDLIVSLQTSLLDSSPGLSTASELPVVETLRMRDKDGIQFTELCANTATPVTLDRDSGTSLVLCRLPTHEVSYAEMVHPSDFQSIRFRSVNGDERRVEISFHASAGQLEKGVIRRIRIRGIFLPREGDQTLAAECYADLKSAPPPLTT